MYNKYSKYNNNISKVKVVSNELEIDWELLITLLKKQSPSKSKHQEKFVRWLNDYVKEISGVNVHRDKIGNTYIQKGNAEFYPCIVAHTDTAQDYIPEMYVCKTDKLIVGINETTGERCGLGADKICPLI